jgi:hypothetical protein
MIQLKKILNELDVNRGHFTKDSSMELIGDYLYYDGVIPKSVADKVMDEIDKSKGEKPLSKDLQSLLTSKAGVKIYGSGTVSVFKKPTADGIIYSGFDFSQPAKKGLFFFGRLFTVKMSKRLNFSPKKQLNIDNAEEIHLSQVSKDYLGKGYGKLLYDAAIKSTDILYSDRVLFEGSFKMWINHIRRNSKFFGVGGWGDVILPVFSEDGLNKTKLGESEGGFVAIPKKVPPQLVKLQEFLNGKEPHELVVFYTRDKLQNVIKDVESFGALDDFTEKYDLVNGDVKYGVGYIITGNATIFVKESGDDLEYFVL